MLFSVIEPSNWLPEHLGVAFSVAWSNGGRMKIQLLRLKANLHMGDVRLPYDSLKLRFRTSPVQQILPDLSLPQFLR